MADTGKYMVVATNAGGEAQSTADIAVLQCESAAQPAPQPAPQKHVSFVDMVQQQQPIYQQPAPSAATNAPTPTQMYSSFSSTQQFQASSTLAQQQYSQSSMQYQPFKPSLAVEAPVRAPSPAPVPTFVPSQAAPPPTQSFPPKMVPFKPTPAPSAAPAMFTPTPAPAPAPVSVPVPAAVQPFNAAVPAPSCTLTPIAGATPAFLAGPSYNQTPQPFKPLPPPTITPSALGGSTPAAALQPDTFSQAAYAPPQAPPQAYAPPAPEPTGPISLPPYQEPLSFSSQPTVEPLYPGQLGYQQPTQQQPPQQYQQQVEQQQQLYQQQQMYQQQVYQQQQQQQQVYQQQQQQQHFYMEQQQEEEVYKKKSVKETKKIFEESLLQQQAAYGELKAPRIVQGVRLPVAAPLPPDFGYGAIAELGLEPGPQPTMGCAPKASNERRSSYCREQIEQSLLESMDKEPERVPAGGVKIVPPSPRKKSKPSPTAVGQSDTAGGAPAPFEQPAELQQGLGAKTKSPYTATESEYESDLDGTGARRQNGYLADTEEVVQKTAAVSFEQQQTIESFSTSSKVESHSSVVSEVIQQQSAQVAMVEQQQMGQEQQQQQVFQEMSQQPIATEELAQPQEQQQQSEEVIISSSETVQKETVEESKSSFLVNNDLPEDLQPVKVLPTEEPLPTLKHVPVPAAVQPVPEQAPAPEPAIVEPQQPLQPQLQQPDPIAPTPVQQNGYPTPSPAQPFLSDYESDAAAPSLAGYKSVHPVFAPPKQEFASGPAAPPPSVFDPIDKIQANQVSAPTDAPKIEKPKAISYVQQQQQQQYQSYQQQQTSSFQQQSYQQQSYQQQQQQQQQSFPPAVQSMPAQYYTSVTAQPVHNTIATETSNSLHMKEMTESSNRVVNMQQTKRVVSLEQQQQHQQQHQQSSVFMQKPGRFTPGEYRDSDGYDSDGTRIRPMWTPNPSDSDEPHYRSVRPNFQQSRSASLPRQHERIQTPMEFDTLPVQMPTKIDLSAGVESSQHQRSSSLSRQSTQIETTTTMTTETLKTQTLDRYASKRLATTPVPNTRDDMAVKAHRVAPINYIQKQADGMAQTFKTKAYHFNNEVMTDMKKTPIKPILKNAYGAPMAQPQPPQPIAQPQATAAPPQVYREESRVSQYGTKHVDPDTGIIYFKYDFGYEFGIIFPGEGHRIVAGRAGGGNGRKHPRYTQNTAQFAAGDIEVPVQHERTRDYYRTSNRGGLMPGPTPYGVRSASVPATEMHASARYGPVPFATPESAFRGEGSGRSTPSRGHSNRNSYCATPDPAAQGLNRSTTSTPNVKHQEEGVPTKTPLFVAPLKDIAVVSGQPARFECIVACDAAPSIRWTKNEAPIEEGYKFMPEYRNGVCRLSLPVAYEGDAGRYCCLAENHLGYAATCAELTVANSDWRANQ